jgi:spermidine/putrescine transport system permease protein
VSERERPAPPKILRLSLPVVLALLYLPLVAMVIASFNDQGVFTFRWYGEVAGDPGLWSALGRSGAVAGGSSAISAMLGVLGALALDKWGFRARPALRLLSGLSLMLPELVLALALLSWFAMFAVPLSLWTVIAAHVTLTLPFVILVVGARLKALDPAYDDAARDLGAGETQVFFRVTLPLLGPSILTSFVLAFSIFS